METVDHKLKGSVIALFFVAFIFVNAGSALAAAGSGWHHHVSLYGWAAGVEGTAKYPVDSGSDLEVDSSDILDALNGVFMGNYTGGYDRWSVLVDAVYINIGSTENTETRLGTASLGLDLKSWVLTGAVGYDFVQSEQAILGVIGGVRYLTLDTDLEIGFDEGTPVDSTSKTASITDGIVGVRGQFNFNEHWFLPYYADIGGGGSDYTYQLFAAIGYRYKWFDVTLGYRHLYYKFDDDELLEDLQISGPKIGIGFSF